MEVSFAREIEKLSLGEGAIFRGEAILAVTKALLQSGVAYVGGYQGAPVSHLLDVMLEARDLMARLGVHVEASTGEAGAAAMLGASIGYPVRGAVTWKSIVGTNVAADALSNLASAGVTGGVLIVVGEDYGEGASVIQERTLAFALKSSFWLLDPRPDLPTLVRLVEQGFALSEASRTPVMLELRIRACHRYGEFVAKDNLRSATSTRVPLAAPHAFDYNRLSHPPATFAQEQDKLTVRLPAARRFIVEHGLNEIVPGDLAGLGIVVLGGLHASLLDRLVHLGLAERSGMSRVPLLVLNVVHPLVPEQIATFVAGRRRVLIVEEGHPAFVEQAIRAELHAAGIDVRIHGKDLLPPAGEYALEALEAGLVRFLDEYLPDAARIASAAADVAAARARAAELLGALPVRPPTFCTGCPERPVFTALKLLQAETGPRHVSADIGCHALATFAPFDSGHTILGYGMSLAASAAVARTQAKRPISVMGDGGFWHNGLTSGVGGAVLSDNDSVLLVLDNGYSAATGAQSIVSSRDARAAPPRASIQAAVRALGVRWVRTVGSYDVRRMTRVLREAVRSSERGLKMIVATGECMLARGRRESRERAARVAQGRRVVEPRFGVDEDVCTGDRSCVRLSGCPSLSVRDRVDPLRRAPVAYVTPSCVGCGLCGEVAHAARLCPSFHRVDVVRNPTRIERAWARVRAALIERLSTSPQEAP